MTKQAARRNVLTLVMVPAAFLLGLVLAVVVAGSASADSPLPTTSTSGTTTTSSTGLSTGGFDQNSPQAQFLVINGTVNATSDHEIVGSSAFPNFTTGAVDNYYSLSRSYMDNSPFSEGTASPADTGPVGQTAAAGNTQQPQYADARWPGGPATANFGSKGQPFAEAGAYESLAEANASEASNGLSSPGLDGSKTLPAPKGFDDKLAQALAGWKAKYLGCPSVPKTSTSPLPTVTVPEVTVPTVKTPTTTVTTPLGTVTTPSAPSVPSVSPVSSTRSLTSVPTPCSSESGSGSSDGESLLESSSRAVLVPGSADKNTDISKVDTTKLETTPTTTTDTTETAPTTTGSVGAWNPKPYTLMMGGSSSVGRVTLGGGQIVIKGISVDASVENDGTATPTYKTNVSVASASIGGIPVTIDQDGVTLANQHQAVPYQQASDSLNGALKQAGIQIFLVAPQVTNCGQSGSGTGTSTSTTTTTTTTDTTTTDQSSTSGPCSQTGSTCSSTATGTDTTSTSTSATTTTSSTGGTDTTSTAPPCPPPPTTCDTGTTSTNNMTTTGNTTTTSTTPATPTIGGSTTNSSTGQTDTTSIGPPSSCSGAPPTTGPCPGTSTGTTTTTTSTDTTATAGAPNPMGGAANAGQETIVMATGVHVVFTQPVSPSGVPAQFVEHILGEVYVDSLAAPAAPLPAIGPLGLGSSPSSCPGGKHSKSSLKSGGGGGSSTAGGTSSGSGGPGSSSGSSSLSPTGSALGASSQPGSGGGGSQSLPAVFARALKKPLWLLLAYVIWQLLVIGTGWSLWNWRRGEPS